MKPQTISQILRCLTLGRYTAAVLDDGHLEIRGPRPLAGPLPASVEARRDELVSFLNGWCDGAWPPAPGSGIREVERVLGRGLAEALDAVEEESEGAA